MTLTKNDIVLKINEEIGLTKYECLKIVESAFELMKEELAAGKPVMISGFGKWEVLNKHARKGRNPQTGETITLDARKVVSFKSSQVLRQSVKAGD